MKILCKNSCVFENKDFSFSFESSTLEALNLLSSTNISSFANIENKVPQKKKKKKKKNEMDHYGLAQDGLIHAFMHFYGENFHCRRNLCRNVQR